MDKYTLNALLLQVINKLRKAFTFGDTLRLKGTVNLSIYGADGELIERRTIKNLVVNIGKGKVCANISVSTPSNLVTQIGAGTSPATPTLTDAALTGSAIIALGTPTYPTGTSVEWPFTFGTGDANGITIQEFGLITAGGALFSRITIAPIAKTSAISVVGAWNVSL